MAPAEPKVKNAVVFVDGQNLYRAAKDAFGYNYPNYDIRSLATGICSSNGWNLKETHFYTGVPDSQDDPIWHNFWSRKLSYMGRLGIKLFSRSLRYHNQSWSCPACKKIYTSLVGHEKGIDVRIALDIIRLAHEKAYDVAVIFSQDQDLSEVADEVRRISIEQNRWIKVASAFPTSPTLKNNKGINKTEWIKIDKRTYDSCIDPNDYRSFPII